MKEITVDANSPRTGDIAGQSSVLDLLSSRCMVSWSNPSIFMAFITFHMPASPKHIAIEPCPAPDAISSWCSHRHLKYTISHSHPSICFAPHNPSLERCHHSQLVVENRNLYIILTVSSPLFQCNSTL